jgi:hypothetical protein
LAIDEIRADFDRVPWVNDGQPPNREIEEGAWFQQYWFAGDYSDVGGSYPENESRLSDLSLGWMTTEAKRAGLIVNTIYWHCLADPTGRSTTNAGAVSRSSACASSGGSGRARWSKTSPSIGR